MFGFINFKGDSPDYAWLEVSQVSLRISFKLMFAGSFFKLLSISFLNSCKHLVWSSVMFYFGMVR